MDKLIEPILLHYGKKQLTKTIEEMSELIKELCKNINGKNNKEEIKEELADCYIMLEQIKLFYKFDSEELQNIMFHKLHRTIKQIDKEIQERMT